MSELKPAKDAMLKHTLGDWLNLHELTDSECRQLLDLAAVRLQFGEQDESIPDRPCAHLEGDQAWALAAEAMSNCFPAFRPFIDATKTKARVHFFTDARVAKKAFTLDDGGSGYPHVFCRYNGSASDLLVVQHEFGHAVQIMASGGSFLPPIMREVCAFISELSLVVLLCKRDLELGNLIKIEWRRQAAASHKKHGSTLARALGDLANPYTYSWNYPIARLVALESFARLSSEQLWRLFAGKATVRKVVQMLGLPDARS